MLQLIYTHTHTHSHKNFTVKIKQWFDQRISSFERNGIYVNWMKNCHRWIFFASFVLNVSQSVSEWVCCHGRRCQPNRNCYVSNVQVYKQLYDLFSFDEGLVFFFSFLLVLFFLLVSYKSNAIMVSYVVLTFHQMKLV